MHLIMVGIQLILFILLFTNMNRLPYVLSGFYLLGVISSVFGIDASFITVAGITLGASDIITAIMLIYFFRKPFVKKNIVNLFLACYFVILLIALITGWGDGNMSVIIANIRKYFEYVIPWFVVINISDKMQFDKDKLNQFFDKCAIIVVVCCLIGFGFYITGRADSPRSISSNSTMILACYFFYKVYSEIYVNERSFMSIKSLIILATIILLQHNSVWVATALGLVIILFITIKKRGIGAIPGMVIMMVLLFAGYIYITEYSTGVIAEYMQHSISKFEDMETGTIGHRKERWKSMLQTLSGYEYIIGQNFSVATIAGDGTTFSAHNAYVAAMMHGGILGVIGLSGALIFSVLGVLRKKSYLNAAIFLAVAVYWYAYEPSMEIVVILGVLYTMSVYKHRKPEEKEDIYNNILLQGDK